MRRAAARALAIAVALLGCASSPLAVDPTGWHEVRSPELVVLGNLETDRLRELAVELARFQALVKKVTNARIEQPSVPVRLYIFRESEQAKPFTGWAAGVMISSLSGYFAVLAADAPRHQTRQTLLHEYAHYIIQSGRRHAYPRWYDEGLSEFLSSSRFRDDAVIVGVALSGRLGTLEHRGPLPLEDLFGREFRRVDVFRFYATSWALVHHLNTSREGRLRLGRYVKRLVGGEHWRSAYAASFEQSLAALEVSLAAHIAKLQSGVRLDYHLPLEQLSVAEVGPESPVASAEIAYQLGGVARARARLTDEENERVIARRLFEHSVASDPAHDRARAALAALLARDGSWDASLSQLAQLGDAVSTDPVVALEVARVATLRAEAPGAGSAEREAARAALEGAVRLGPELPEAYAALARFQALVGEARPAISAFERARELGAWSPRVEVDLARQHLAVGEPDRARDLLRPVAADAHGGETAEEAQELLYELGARSVSER